MNEKKREYNRRYYRANRERLLANQAKRDVERVEEKREYNRERYWRIRDKMRKQQAEWYRGNKEQRSVYNKKWRRNNPDKVRANMQKWWKDNPNQLALRRIGGEVRRCLKGHPKATRYWEKLVGYTLEDLVSHLEAQFKNGMSWDNHGEWHIDHVKSVSSFSSDQIKECWSLDNLQPLWADENVAKGVGS